LDQNSEICNRRCPAARAVAAATSLAELRWCPPADASVLRFAARVAWVRLPPPGNRYQRMLPPQHQHHQQV